MENSYKKLDQVSTKFDKMGSSLVDLTRYFPYLSKISSGKNLVSAGRNFSEIGMLVSASLKNIEKIKRKSRIKKNPLLP